MLHCEIIEMSLICRSAMCLYVLKLILNAHTHTHTHKLIIIIISYNNICARQLLTQNTGQQHESCSVNNTLDTHN